MKAIKYSSLTRRIIAFLIDFAVIFFTFVISIILFLSFYTLKLDLRTIKLDNLLLSLLFIISYITYFTVLEFLHGKTFGKSIVKIKVISDDGKKISLLQSLLRNILRLVDGSFIYLPGIILILIRKDKKRLGDIIAKTIVVIE